MQQPETMRGPQQQPQQTEGAPTVCQCPVCGVEHPMAYRGWGHHRMWHAGMGPKMGFMGGMGVMSVVVGFIAGYLVGSSRH